MVAYCRSNALHAPHVSCFRVPATSSSTRTRTASRTHLHPASATRLQHEMQIGYSKRFNRQQHLAGTLV